MSGYCPDCGNTMCSCDSEGNNLEGVVMSGVMISSERYEELKSLQLQNKILKKALKDFAKTGWTIAREALEKIKEMEK